MKREFIQKEEEKHQLIYTGVIQNLQEVVNKAIGGFHQHNVGREEFLHYFYTEVIDFSYFIAHEKSCNEKIKKHLYHSVQTYLLETRKNNPAPLDQDLKTGAQLTIAYYLSNSIFQNLYSLFCQEEQPFKTPYEIKEFLFKETKKRYPISFEFYLELLQKDDSSFWDRSCLYIKELSQIVLSCVTARQSKNNYQDIVQDNVWTDTYLILRDRLVHRKGNIPVFQTGKDLRNYIAKICNLLTLNNYKKYSSKEVYMEELLTYSPVEGEKDEANNDMGWFQEMDFFENTREMEFYTKELDIDIENPYEVAYAVSIILLNTNHPAYPLLTQGIEDRVSILIERSVNGKSYKEIVEEQYGTSIDKEQFQRAVVKTRKDYERVKGMLTQRLIELIKNKQKKNICCHISDSSNIVK
ncbi:hypothetical protein M2480_000967 [Parabacteroides sp. PFB2-12]|uniref:hypothetical protein n=1 Tax=unclassified Parabacteroides TaxID=2649774 RepID=UPI002473319D|nr:MULTISPECIES: hypothetical protein [unclassified Parabacteroides]MDH6341576.1 hypothetical protein [Parabacteroides sp. PM6-13]MDH6390001.1 hypothetical protein [Parabacteroides sp. PFB2-12]